MKVDLSTPESSQDRRGLLDKIMQRASECDGTFSAPSSAGLRRQTSGNLPEREQLGKLRHILVRWLCFSLVLLFFDCGRTLASREVYVQWHIQTHFQNGALKTDGALKRKRRFLNFKACTRSHPTEFTEWFGHPRSLRLHSVSLKPLQGSRG